MASHENSDRAQATRLGFDTVEWRRFTFTLLSVLCTALAVTMLATGMD